MSTAKQRARARADLESGQPIQLLANKVGLKKRQRLVQEWKTKTEDLAKFLETELMVPGLSISSYHMQHEGMIYVRHRSFSHSLWLDYSKHSLTVHQDTAAGGQVWVIKSTEQLLHVLKEILS